MGMRHVQRLKRARELLEARGYRTDDTKLTCYSGSGFDEQLQKSARDNPHIQLIDLNTLYGIE